MDYVFGYASLVALREALPASDSEPPAAPLLGRLRGFRRHWGAAMDNWDEANDVKHWVEPASRRRPRLRVAYLDIEPVDEEEEGGPDVAGTAEGAPAAVNGLAIPVDAARLALLDLRERNYERIDVSAAFQPDGRAAPARVYAYRATEAARTRCRAGAACGDVRVSAEYLSRVRRGFAALGPDALAEYERTTVPLPFPVADLEVVAAVHPLRPPSGRSR